MGSSQKHWFLFCFHYLYILRIFHFRSIFLILLASELFQYSDFIIPNETEAELLTGCRVTTIDEARTAASALRAKGCNNVIITLGERGALFLGKDLLREWIFFQTTESSHLLRITSLHSGKKCKSSYHIPIPSVSQDLVVDTTGKKGAWIAQTKI